MTDQYAFFLAVSGAFVLGMLVPVLWRKFFGKEVDIDILKSRIYDFVVSMDESDPSMPGATKKQRVIALVKKYVPNADEELVSYLINTVVGLWRLESDGVSPKQRAEVDTASRVGF